MKVGIVTYHRSHNYGAMLQAYGLRRFLSDCGHDARFVDYWPEHQRNRYRLFPWPEFVRAGLRGKTRILRRLVRTLPETLSRRNRFNLFFAKEILPHCTNPADEFDLIVYGSDQIWRKQMPKNFFNPVYFGQNGFKAKRSIAYAASMGVLPDSVEDGNMLRSLVERLDAVSVRESDLQAYLTESGVANVEWTADPVFLPSTKMWSELAGPTPLVPDRYLLFYDLNRGAFEDTAVDSFAKCHGMQVIRIGIKPLPTNRRGFRKEFGPYEFLNLVKFADFVVSSSYHGLCFSILFEKPFLSSFPNPQRARSLLSKVGLSDCLVQSGQQTVCNCPAIDWHDVRQHLSKFREQSIEWLSEALDSNR